LIRWLKRHQKQKPREIGDTHCDVEAEALVDTLDETPLQEKAETFGDSMGDVKAKRSTRWLKQYHTRSPRHLYTHLTI